MSGAPDKPTMQLLNVIVTFDVYCFAGTGDDASDNAIGAICELIRSGKLTASHLKALPLRVSPVRPAWRDERPIVACDVSDEDYAKLKGKTTQEAYDLLTKRAQ